MASDVIKENEKWINNFEINFNVRSNSGGEFKDILKRIAKEQHITALEVEDRVHINEKTFRRWLNGEEQRPFLKSLIAFFIEYEIDYGVVLETLSTLNMTLILTNKVHYAYYNLLTNYKCCSQYHKLLECNQILNKLEIDEAHWLGNDDDKQW